MFKLPDSCSKYQYADDSISYCCNNCIEIVVMLLKMSVAEVIIL